MALITRLTLPADQLKTKKPTCSRVGCFVFVLFLCEEEFMKLNIFKEKFSRASYLNWILS